MSCARARPALLFALCALLCGALAAAPATVSELGRRQFTCKTGELSLVGDRGHVRYAPGSYQVMRIPTALGLLRYTCKSIRGVVTCPLDTTAVTVKRDVFPGRFDVRCYGVVTRGAPRGGELPAAPDAATDAGSE